MGYVTLLMQKQFKFNRTFATTIDTGIVANWSAIDCVLSQGTNGVIVTPSAGVTPIIYKSYTPVDADFPMEITFSQNDLELVQFGVQFKDAGLSKTLQATYDQLNVKGVNSFRIRKSDFTTSDGMTWVEAAYMLVFAIPYTGTATFELYPIYGGVTDNACVVFSFDDGLKSHITTIKPMMDVYGFKGTSFVVPAWVGLNATFMDLPDIQELDNALWDIGNHGYNSTSATGQSVETIQADYEDYVEWANENGVERACLHMAYPDGVFNDNSDTAFANAGLLTGRTIKNSLNTGQGNPAYMHSLLLMSTNILSDYTDALAKVKAVGGILYVVIHDVIAVPVESYQISTTLFGQILAATDVPVLKISETHRALLKARYI